MRYINHATYGFILFHPPLKHDGMVRLCGFERDDIVSAGFVKNIDNQLVCCGRSTTLEKKAIVTDSEELQAMQAGTLSVYAEDIRDAEQG